MNAVLILVFLLAGHPKEVQVQVAMDACMSGAVAQIQITKYLEQHPNYTYDPKSGWRCRIGGGKDNPPPFESES